MDTSLSNHVNFDNTENKANVSNTSSQVTAGDGIGGDFKDSLAKANLHSNHIKDINKLKDEKHKEQKNRDDKHKLDKHKHHKDEKKHREDKVKEKHKDEKLKDKPKVEKSKDDKHKDHKHKDIHNSTGKPKDSQQISSSSSSSSLKLKENYASHLDSSKLKDGSSLSKITEDGKLKEKINNSSNSISKPKISSSSKTHNVSINDKSKDQSHKPKDNSLSIKKSEEKKHHQSSSEKLKNSVGSQKKEHLNNKSERKHDKGKESEKHRFDEKKIKDEKKHKEKENHEKLKEHISKNKEHNLTKDKTKSVQDIKIKTEPDSPTKFSHKELSTIKSPMKESSRIKEESPSEDEIPLGERKLKFLNAEMNNRLSSPSKSFKRSSENDSDEEPLSIRLAKANKKIKTDRKEAKKRQMEDSDDEPYAKKKKKNAEIKKAKDQKDATPSPRKRSKAEQEEKEVWKWWEEEKYDGGIKWKTLEHKGPVFAPPYERLPNNIKFYYDGKHMQLSEGAEEVASFYAKMLDHDYTTKDVFNKNFFKDWRKMMKPSEKELIVDLKKCNFSELNEYFKEKSEERKNMTKEEKAEIKKKNEEISKEYGTCVIDGHTEKIGNFKIEPPGLFRGRGEHPKMGMLKQRIMPEDVIINCSKNENVPKPPPGRKWKEVRHDNTVTWLACWTENIQGQTKYVMLNASSKLKGEKDWQKYEVARKLKQFVDKIREQYRLDWKSKEMKVRQRAVALYFIDKLALRAGNEKEEGETADTVGCCSLRVEHINLVERKGDQEFVVEFDFLGKDSIRYQNSVPVEKRVFKNLQLFIENKKPDDDLFDRLNTSILNKHLNELMDGLTAKVFRTFNASKTLQEQLELLTKPDDSIPAKILAYNRANRAVAILCNHQRSVPKTFGKSMENLQNKIKAKRDQVDECERECKQLKKDAKRNRSQKDQQLYERKKKALERLQEQLNKLEVQATDKEENKDIALGTSKLNYLDPRISVAWCKKWNVPIEKIYNKTQRDKFRWAIEMAGPDFKF